MPRKSWRSIRRRWRHPRGAADGSLCLFDVHRTGCPILAQNNVVGSPDGSSTDRAVTQLVADPSSSFVFIVRSGAVLYASCTQLIRAANETDSDIHHHIHHGGGSGPTQSAASLGSSALPKLPLLAFERHQADGDVRCIATSWSRQLGVRVCCATSDGRLRLYSVNQATLASTCTLRLAVAYPPSFGGASVVSMAWCDDDSLWLADALLAVVDMAIVGHRRRRCARARVAGGGGMLQSPPHGAQAARMPVADEAAGRHAACFGLAAGDVLFLGITARGGAAAAASIPTAERALNASPLSGAEFVAPVVGAVGSGDSTRAGHVVTAPLSRPSVQLEGRGLPHAAAVAWPYLVTASRTAVRVYDLMVGKRVQVVPLHAVATPSDGVGSGGAARLTALGPHLLVFSLGASLYILPPARGGELAREERWLRQLCVRPWDVTLVEQHMAHALHPDGSTPARDADAADVTAALPWTSAAQPPGRRRDRRSPTPCARHFAPRGVVSARGAADRRRRQRPAPRSRDDRGLRGRLPCGAGGGEPPYM